MREFLFKLKIKTIIKIEDWIIFPIRHLPMNIAFKLPRKIQLWCFVVVAGCNGDYPYWYKEAYDRFVLKYNIKGM